MPSVGSRGDSYDNALAESFNGLYKTELIRHGGPWRGLDDVEYATLEYVDWFNHRRLHGELGMLPPAEFEAADQHQSDRPCWRVPNSPSLYKTRGGSLRLVNQSKGFQQRAVYRDHLAQLSDGMSWEIQPEDDETLRKLKVNVRRAANELNLNIRYGETA